MAPPSHLPPPWMPTPSDLSTNHWLVTPTPTDVILLLSSRPSVLSLKCYLKGVKSSFKTLIFLPISLQKTQSKSTESAAANGTEHPQAAAEPPVAVVAPTPQQQHVASQQQQPTLQQDEEMTDEQEDLSFLLWTWLDFRTLQRRFCCFRNEVCSRFIVCCGDQLFCEFFIKSE